MIVCDDYIIKDVGSSGRKDKFYRTYCNNCGHDRGYLLKSQDRRPKCNKCNKLGSTVSSEVKHKMSLSAFNRKPRLKNKIDGRSIRDKSTYVGPKRFLSDEQRKIKHSMRTLIWQKLKNRGVLRKTNRTFNLLGYSPEDLIRHLESKWQPGMSWDNYGEWHIDHIVPDSWFNYKSTNENGFKQSWNIDNLQPMWAELNHRKGNRYAGCGL